MSRTLPLRKVKIFSFQQGPILVIISVVFISIVKTRAIRHVRFSDLDFLRVVFGDASCCNEIWRHLCRKRREN